MVYGLSGAALVIAAIIVVVVVTGSSSGSKGGNGSFSQPKVATVPIKTLASDLHPTPSPGTLGPEGIPIPHTAPLLATNSSTSTGNTVNGIHCNAGEKLVYHVHTHLTVFVNGSQRQIPYGIGIVPPRQVSQTAEGPFVTSGTCFYWLHTHAADGIIHTESPVHRTYTLGNFFNIWGQPLGPGQVGPAHGHVTAIYNGRAYQGNPRDIPLNAHAQIQLEVGTPLIGPTSITWPSGL